MIDHPANLLALRARLLTLSVCATGAVSLSANAAGYARLAGSFITDGFAIGMEVLASGFTDPANNGISVIKELTATQMDVVKTTPTVAEGAGFRTLAVGLPATVVWRNESIETPVGRPYLEEDYLDGPTSLITVGPNGIIEGLPQYVLRVYGLSNSGDGGISKYIRALLTLFTPKTAMAVGSDTLRVRGDVGPSSTALRPAGAGWALSTVTIPLRIRSANSI